VFEVSTLGYFLGIVARREKCTNFGITDEGLVDIVNCTWQDTEDSNLEKDATEAFKLRSMHSIKKCTLNKISFKIFKNT
jgi:hypothetical protein